MRPDGRSLALGKHLPIIRKGLKFQRIPAGIADEHGLLLAGFSRKAQIGLDDKLSVRSGQTLGELIKAVIIQDQAEMPDRDLFAVDRIGRPSLAKLGRQMGDDLMAEQIKIDPMIALPPRAAAQHAGVEGPRRLQFVDWKRKVKAGAVAHGGLQISSLGFAHCGASA